jgi:hypothetical protein
MKNAAGIAAAAAGAVVLGALLLYKKKDGTRVYQELLNKGKDLGGKLARYGNDLKERLLHHVTGPNGELVYLDMYDRQFYEGADGKRIYIEEA